MILPSATVIQTLGLVGHMTSVAFAVMKGALENLKGKVYDPKCTSETKLTMDSSQNTILTNLLNPGITHMYHVTLDLLQIPVNVCPAGVLCSSFTRDTDL